MRFIANEPALMLGKSLVISDIHIGIETQYWKAGFKIMSHVEEMAEHIIEIAEKNRAKRIVLNGDIKDNIAFPSRREEKYLVEFYGKLSGYEVISIKGNHDGGIEKFAEPVKSWKWRSIVVTHGHRKVEGNGKFIIGHNHPILRIKDRGGSYYSQRVWLISTGLTIMPAFNDLAGGHDIREGLQGPIAKGRELESFHIHLLNGIEVDVDELC